MPETSATPDLRFPVGKFSAPGKISRADLDGFIDEIAQLPAKLRQAVAGLNDQQLDTAYRPGGWTVRQVVHHLPDSHMNAYIRFKLALTENSPTIKAYDEAAWAEIAEARTGPVAPSLALTEGLHQRWANTLRGMSAADFARTFHHPERGEMRLDVTAAMYAWHCRHHVAHIVSLRQRMGW